MSHVHWTPADLRRILNLHALHSGVELGIFNVDSQQAPL